MVVGMNARRTEPSRSLTDRRKPHRYVPASHTDISVTIAKFRRLQAMQRTRGDESDDAFAFEPAPAPLTPIDGDQYQRDAIAENAGPFIPENY